MEKENLDFEVARDLFIEIKHYAIQDCLKKCVGILDFVILDIDLAFNRYCLWSWDYSPHALRYSIVFFWKKLLLLACFIWKYAVFMWILGFQWLIQVYWYTCLQVYRKPCSSCKPKEEWRHIALPCYTLFCMKCLIADRLTRARFMSLWNVWSWFYYTKFFIRTNYKLQETKVLFRTYIDSRELVICCFPGVQTRANLVNAEPK